MDQNQAVWHMGLAVDDPDVADLMDDWGEVVALGFGEYTRLAWEREPALCSGCGHRPYWCRCRCQGDVGRSAHPGANPRSR